MNENSLHLHIQKTLKGQVDEISFVDSNTFMTSTTGSAVIWENDKPQKTLSLPGHINGAFFQKEQLISSGIMQYDLSTDKAAYQTRYIASLVSVFAPECVGLEDQFEVSYTKPLPNQDRLILALHFRPTRRPNRKDPSPLPKDVIGLLKLSDASVVTVLDSGSFPVRRPVVMGTKLFYGCNDLKCWDLISGKNEAKFEFFRLYEFAEGENGVFVFLENGEVWNAQQDGTSKKLATLPLTVRHALYLKEYNSLLLGDNKNGLHVVSCSDFTIKQTLQLEREANGIFLHPDRRHVYVPIYITDTFLKIKLKE